MAVCVISHKYSSDFLFTFFEALSWRKAKESYRETDIIWKIMK